MTKHTTMTPSKQQKHNDVQLSQNKFGQRQAWFCDPASSCRHHVYA